MKLEDRNTIYIADDVELSAIIASVIRRFRIKEGLPRGDQERQQSHWSLADALEVTPAFGREPEVTVARSAYSERRFVRERINVFGTLFSVWREI